MSVEYDNGIWRIRGTAVDEDDVLNHIADLEAYNLRLQKQVEGFEHQLALVDIISKEPLPNEGTHAGYKREKLLRIKAVERAETAEAKVIQLAENVEKLEHQLSDKTREHECCKIWANDTRAELEKARECLSSVHALAHNRPTKDILPEIHKLTECYHDNCTTANGGKE